MIHSLIGMLAMPSSQPGTESGAPGIIGMMPFVLIIVVFYFILIRPQQKQQKEHQKLMEALKNGDQVLMSNGIFGTIMDVKEKTLLVKIADNVKIKVQRSAVAQVVSGEKGAEKEKSGEREKAGVS